MLSFQKVSGESPISCRHSIVKSRAHTVRSRISTSGAGRHPRINPRSAMNYKSWTIPAGVSITSLGIPNNNNAFRLTSVLLADAGEPDSEVPPREPRDLPLPSHLLTGALGWTNRSETPREIPDTLWTWFESVRWHEVSILPIPAVSPQPLYTPLQRETSTNDR